MGRPTSERNATGLENVVCRNPRSEYRSVPSVSPFHGTAELHVFADASVMAYGAAAYLVLPSSTRKKVCLVSAKARVAPLHQTRIPRLELMAALVATRLAKTICNELKIKPTQVVLWSDSMIVLSWLPSEVTIFKSFLGVWVREIQASFEPSVWRYVPSNLNPADDLCRGITVDEMKGRWMNGPPFLRNDPEQWPTETNETSPEIPEMKASKPLLVLQPSKPSTIIDPTRYSNWPKLCCVRTYCFRFINIAVSRTIWPLSPRETAAAECYWVKAAQLSWETGK